MFKGLIQPSKDPREIFKNAFKDKDFRDYYENFTKGEIKGLIDQVQNDIKRLRTDTSHQGTLDQLRNHSTSLQAKLQELNEKYKENKNIIEFNKLYTQGTQSHKVLDATLKVVYEGLDAGNQELTNKDTKEKDKNLFTEIREKVKILESKGIGSKIQGNQRLSEEDLNSLKDIYKYLESCDPKVRDRFFTLNVKRLVGDENTLRKLCTGEDVQIGDKSWYTDDQIRMVGKEVLKDYCNVDGHEYIERLTYDLIDQDFVRHILEIKKPIFISFNVGNVHWIAICIVNIANKLKVLFKDPRGESHKYIEEKFKKGFAAAGVNVTNEDFFHDNRIEQIDSYNCGPIAIKNLEILAKTLFEHDGQHLVDNFLKIKFVDSKQASDLRKKHNSIINKIIESERKESKELCDTVKRSYNKDLTHEELEEHLPLLNRAIKLDSNNKEAKELLSNILLDIAGQYFDSGEFERAYKYTEKSILAYKNEEAEKLKDKLKGELLDHLPKSGEKNQEQLLTEIQASKEINTDELASQLSKVKAEKKYINYSKADIAKWAQEVKDSKRGGQEDICEYIAMIDRANYIDTFERTGVGHNLRDSQILSILAFFNTNTNGMLEQIKTGEGKSTIVSVLAIIHALQGKKVDVLTSSPILAERDAEEKSSLYKLFDLSVAHNSTDLNYYRGEKECYKADILYGSISNFQFDLLRHEHQDLETRGKQENERPFDRVIIDEADSMLVDNGGHLAKLSGPLPGMEYLEPLLVYVWHHVKEIKDLEDLIKKVEEGKGGAQEQLNKVKKDIADKVNDAIIRSKIILPKIQEDLSNQSKSELTINNSKPIVKEIELFIPKHIVKYAQDQVERWVDNAIKAAINFEEDREYTIEDKGGQKIAAPVDFVNTGSVQKGLIWSDGLHQFLQLKHGLRLSPESCNTSYISNIGYIKRYIREGGEATIFGLTGTLGGEKERGLLSESYKGISFLEIPTYKEKIFTKHPTILKASQSEWLNLIVKDTLDKAKTRAVLLICETIEEAKLIHNTLQKSNPSKLKSYLKDDQSNVTEERMDVGDILVATNLAGRGTDIKLSSRLIENGGMHVCLTFLPSNQRVEDQALGRTSRQGNPGTGQLIIKETDFVKGLKKQVGSLLKIEEKKVNSNDEYVLLEVIRDIQEQVRVEEIINIKLKAINLSDELFNQFSKLCKQLKEDHNEIWWFYIVIKAIEERWGLWLKDQDINNWIQKYPDIADNHEATINQIHEKFKEFENKVLQGFYGFLDVIKSSFNGKNDQDGSLKVIENPFYLIAIGEYCLNERRDVAFAKKALEKAIVLASEDEVIAAGAHYLLAFAEIELGKAAENVLSRASSALLPFLDFTNKQDRAECVEQSLKHLKTSKAGLERITSLNMEIVAYLSSRPEPIAESFLLQHLLSKIKLLNLFTNYVNTNINVIENAFANDGNSGYLGCKSNIKFTRDVINFGADKSAKEAEKKTKEEIKDQEINELADIGFSRIFQPNKIKDLPQEITIAADAQIISGIGLYKAALAFPPYASIIGSVASTALTEGISDLVLGLIHYSFQENDLPFDGKEFAKQKAISVGISLGVAFISAGIAGYFQVAGNLKKGVDAAQTLAQMGEKFLEKFAENLLKSVITNIVMSELVMPVIGSMLEGIKGSLEEDVKKAIRNDRELCNRLTKASEQTIADKLQEVLKGDQLTKILKPLIGAVVSGVGGNFGWKGKLGAMAIKTAYDSAEIATYIGRFCENLRDKLSHCDDQKNNDLDIIIQNLSTQVAAHMHGIISGIVGDTIKSAIDIYREKLREDKEKKQQESEQQLKLTSEQEVNANEKERAYTILGIKPNASEEEIKKAYKEAIRTTHPDKVGESSHEPAVAINNARDVLLGRGKITPTIEDANEARQSTHLKEVMPQALAIPLGREASYTFGSVDDTGGGQNCRHVAIAELMNRIGIGDNHTAASIRTDTMTSTVTPGTREMSKRYLKNRSLDYDHVQSKVSLLQIKDWMNDHNLEHSVLSFRYPNGGGHFVNVRLDNISGKIIVSDKQKNEHGIIKPDQSFPEYFNNVLPTDLVIEGLVRKPAMERTIIATSDGQLFDHRVTQLTIDELSRKMKDLPIKSEETKREEHKTDQDGDVVMAEFGGITALKALPPSTSNSAQQDSVRLLSEYLSAPHQVSKRLLKIDYSSFNANERQSVTGEIVAAGSIAARRRTAFLSLQKSSESIVIKLDPVKRDGTISQEVSYCPYIENTSELTALQQTETIIPRIPDPKIPQENHLFTAQFSGCSLLISIGIDDIKVYHDNKPVVTRSRVFDEATTLRNAQEKYEYLTADNRTLIRVDHSEYKNYMKYKNTVKGGPCQQLFYSADGENTANIFLTHDKSGWHINIQDLENMPGARGEGPTEVSTAMRIIPLYTLLDTQLQGSNNPQLTDIDWVCCYFSKYTLCVIINMLKLRLAKEKLTNVNVLREDIYREDYSNLRILLTSLSRTQSITTLVAVNVNKHAVGIMFVVQDNGSGYKAFYLDPENTTIPEGLATIFKDNGYEIEQLPTEGQRYTNCGPEVIENFMLYLTGERLSQEDAIVNNSRLIEQELLSSSHDAKEASCLTPKDSYSKQDKATVISNTAYNTQVSSDDYIIDNPTRYDIVTPQSIIDGVIVRADLGREPHDVLLELVHDYRINQDYAEAILGEVASIDIG